MVVLHSTDYLEIKAMSLLADYDRDTMVNLYQPIIGYTALAVYFTLWSEYTNQKVTSLCSHGQLMNRMKIATGDFIDARKNLEAVGLLKTYLNEQGDTKLYTYELFSPKTPKKFFDDALLFGLLIKVLGDTEANKYKSIYKIEKSEEDGKDISASFVEVFNPNFDDPAFIKALDGIPSLGRTTGKIVSHFSYEKFFEEMKKISQIKEEAFSKKDMKEIERLAALNGVSEANAAKAVVTIYDAYAGRGKHIDFTRLAKMMQDDGEFKRNIAIENEDEPNLNSGDTALAKKVNLMESVSPKDYLSFLQNGTRPASSDLRLINDISKNFGLPNCVINALIDYTLAVNNNILSRSYMEKVAASLAREGVKTTIDAMNYLKGSNKKPAKRSRNTTYRKEIEKVEPAPKKEEKDEFEGVSWEQMLDDIDDGDPNGKA
ncbi:MAG: DnaD domain protein [Bacilli bacterium]|nr:DnaD domain protein [Bacilli bacterium]